MRLGWRAFFIHLVWTTIYSTNNTTTTTTTATTPTATTFLIHLVWMISKEARSCSRRGAHAWVGEAHMCE